MTWNIIFISMRIKILENWNKRTDEYKRTAEPENPYILRVQQFFVLYESF